VPQSLANIPVHFIWSTKDRQPFIKPEIEKELFSYMAAIFREYESPALTINGTEDHVHSLAILSRKITVAKLIEEVKKSSSKWIKTKGELYRNFYWQSGYAALGIGQSNVETLKRYIANQKEQQAHLAVAHEGLSVIFRDESGGIQIHAGSDDNAVAIFPVPNNAMMPAFFYCINKRAYFNAKRIVDAQAHVALARNAVLNFRFRIEGVGKVLGEIKTYGRRFGLVVCLRRGSDEFVQTILPSVFIIRLRGFEAFLQRLDGCFFLRISQSIVVEMLLRFREFSQTQLEADERGQHICM